MLETNTKHKGNITELKIALALLEHDLIISQPYGDNAPYDWLVETPTHKFIRIQCKTARSQHNDAAFDFSTRSCHRKNGKVVHHQYTSDEIDYFATEFKGQCYLIPISQTTNGSKLLRINPPKSNQQKNINWARDYELEKIVQNWLKQE